MFGSLWAVRRILLYKLTISNETQMVVCCMSKHMTILQTQSVDWVTKSIGPFGPIFFAFGDIKATDKPIEAAPIQGLGIKIQMSHFLIETIRKVADLLFIS